MINREIRLQEIRVRRMELEAELARISLEEMKLAFDGAAPLGEGDRDRDMSAKVLRYATDFPKCSSGDIAQAVFGALPGDRRYHLLIRCVLTSAGFAHRKSGDRRFWVSG